MRTNVIVYLGAAIIVLALATVGFAGTAGDPASPNTVRGAGVFSLKQSKNIDIKTDFETEILFERKMHASVDSNLKLKNGQWYMAGVSCTFFERIAPYVKLGIAHLKAKWTESGKEVDLESNNNSFAWAVGGKALIWDFEKPKIKISTDGFFRAADLDVNKGHYNGSNVTVDTGKSKFYIREWQIALLASTELDLTDGGKKDDVLGVGKIAPYAGGKYSGMNGRIRQVISDGDYHNPGWIKADKHFGVIVGCDFVGPTDSVWVNLEGRFIDETAMTAGVGVLF